jgi:Zn finger protein HypA/HybF involved in hydrogenase expression
MVMKRWWCMDCHCGVNLDKHGRCESCESEAVQLCRADTTRVTPVAVSGDMVTCSVSCN